MPELVVARFTEELNWLRNLSANRAGQPDLLRVTVYDKSPDASGGPDAVRLPNVGREAHTYLHHIVSRYDTLAEWTVFCQGKPFDHAYDFKKFIRAFSDQPVLAGNSERFVPGFQWLGHLIDTDDNQGQRLFQPWSKNEDGRGLDLRGFHRALFDTDGPEFYTFVLGAQFAVHYDVVRSRPLAFYERALAVAITFPDAAHCFERSWDRVFGLTGIDPVWLAGRQTVYLKPMKHQKAVGEAPAEGQPQE